MREHIGKPSLRIDAVELGREISVNMTAARCPPRSDPAKSHALRSRMDRKIPPSHRRPVGRNSDPAHCLVTDDRRRTMPSPTYRLFREAILDRMQITCTYDRRYRELCPHVLGHKDGDEKALTFQFAGDSVSGLPPGGEWRCLSLAQVRDAQLRPGPWRTGFRHSTTQVCVDIVDLDVELLGSTTGAPPRSGRTGK